MTRPLSVLVIEERDADAQLLVDELRREGWDVTWERVNTPQGLEAALDRGEWDLLVSEYRTPGLHAEDALGLCKGRGLDTPFLVTSGTIGEEQATALLKAGVHDFFLKDRFARLGPAVEHELREAQNRLARRRGEEEYQRAREALRASEERHRRLMESVQEIVFTGTLGPAAGREASSLAGRLTFISSQAETILGHRPEEFLASADLWSSLLHPEDVGAVSAWTGQAFAERRPVSRQYRLRSADGRYRWFEDTIIPEVDQSGDVTGFLGAARDVTERLQAEEALRGREAQQRALLEALPDSIFLQTEDGTYLDCHAPDPSPFDRPRDNFLGRRMRDVLPAELSKTFESAFGDALATGRTQVFEYTVEHEARLRHCEARIAPCEGHLLVSVVRDVTERRQAEEDLLESYRTVREAQARYSRASEMAQVGVWDWDLATNEIHVDPALKTMLGFADGEIRNHQDEWGGRVHPEDRERVRDEVRAHLDGSKPVYEVEHRKLHKDGTVRWFLGRGSALRNAAGAPVRLLGADLDVTERRELERMLQKSQQLEAVGQLAGGIAHDFNNILGVITGYGELALRQLGPDHPTRARVTQILKATKRAASLTQQLLAFSSSQVLQPQVLDVSAVVAGVDEMLHRVIGEDIELEVRGAPDLGAVRADPTQLEQVIVNLVVNARDAMPRGGHLTIETANADFDEAHTEPPTKPGRHVMLAVSDTGIGMDAETLRHVFEPFFTTKPSGRGTGLGLATVYGVVKQSGGQVLVQSEPDRGTAFRIYLPRVDEQPMSPIPVVESPRDLGGHETVLLVEDTESLREVVRELLEERGYVLLSAADGEQALAVAAGHPGPIHLLVTDLVMPKMGGADLATQLLPERPDMRVLYMSGYSDGAISRQDMVLEGTVLLEKPFTGERLANAVREVLDGPKRGRG